MDEINLKQIITEFPNCVTNRTKLKAILLDTYPNIQKAMLNTLVVIVNLGIASEIRHCKTVRNNKTPHNKKNQGKPRVFALGFRLL